MPRRGKNAKKKEPSAQAFEDTYSTDVGLGRARCPAPLSHFDTKELTVTFPRTLGWTPVLFFLACCSATVAAGEASGPAEARPVNLAIAATPSASYVSGHETLSAVNDGFEPRHSNDSRHGQYGNWPRRGTQWVQYAWSRPISTHKVDIYWWNDGRGVRIPEACRLLYWDGGAFVPVKNASGLGTAEDQYNTTTFDEVTTRELRLEIDSKEDYSTGILEWKVYDSGNSPPLPPRVEAGVDRVVIAGGDTHLRGTVEALSAKGAAAEVIWSKAAGPGSVTFDNANAPLTTAAFSKPGHYRLKLTASKDELSSASELHVDVRSHSPVQPLQPIDTTDYTIDSRLWNDRVKALIVHWIPHCIEKISDPELKHGGINNFVDAAKKLSGEPHESHRGYSFSNAWVFNTVEAISLALMVDPRGDQEIVTAQHQMRRTLEEWIPKILAAREQDGYLQTFFTLSDRERWSPRHRDDHEGYVAGYFLDAATAHYVMTDGNDRRLYDAARKLADCWDNHIGPAPQQRWYDGHQGLEMALFRFGRLVNQVEGEGRGDKYFDLGKFLLDCRQGGSEYDQSHVPVTEQYEAVGHAVRAAYSYAAMTDVVLETGDIDYQSAVMSLWDNIVNRKYYVTGGIGSGETAEGFGPDYSLPHQGYCESCSSCGQIFFQHKLCLARHQAKYADLYEETLYNALLGSIDLAGENFYYQNPLAEHRFRNPWHVCPCCVGNIPRTLLMLPTWMYAKDADGLYVNLFVGSRVNLGEVAGTRLEVVQETDYPWQSPVSITLNPRDAAEFSVKIRSPKRDVSTLYNGSPNSDGIESITVNGKAVKPPLEDGYVVLKRTWRAGDKIELKLPMKVQRVRGIEEIEATRGQLALRRGPLIYAVEQVDVDHVDQELNGELAAEEELRAEWREDLLRGTMVLTGSWADESPLMAIPYFLRKNRPADSTDSGGSRQQGGGEAGVSRVWIRAK